MCVCIHNIQCSCCLHWPQAKVHGGSCGESSSFCFTPPFSIAGSSQPCQRTAPECQDEDRPSQRASPACTLHRLVRAACRACLGDCSLVALSPRPLSALSFLSFVTAMPARLCKQESAHYDSDPWHMGSKVKSPMGICNGNMDAFYKHGSFHACTCLLEFCVHTCSQK